MSLPPPTLEMPAVPHPLPLSPGTVRSALSHPGLGSPHCPALTRTIASLSPQVPCGLCDFLFSLLPSAGRRLWDTGYNYLLGPGKLWSSPEG